MYFYAAILNFIMKIKAFYLYHFYDISDKNGVNEFLRVLRLYLHIQYIPFIYGLLWSSQIFKI